LSEDNLAKTAAHNNNNNMVVEELDHAEAEHLPPRFKKNVYLSSKIDGAISYLN